MKKSKKILAVLLSVLMLLSSVSVLSFAAKTNYRTSAELDNLGAYSSLGSVTRLTTEERFDIVADFLDNFIASKNLGEKDIDASVLGKLHLDLRSLNGILQTVDRVYDFTQQTFLVINIGNYINKVIGIDNWTKGMSLENNEITGGNKTQNILANLVSILDDSDTVNTLKQPLFTGQRPKISLPLGLDIYSFIPIDVTKACQALGDIGGMIETIAQVNTGRGDDTLADINAMEADDGDILKTANRAIWKLFTRPTLKAVYKENAAGQQVDENGVVITESSSAYLDTSRIVDSIPSGISYRELFKKDDAGAEKVIYRYAYEGKFDLLGGGYLTEKVYTPTAEKAKGAYYYVRTPVYEKDAQGLDTSTVKYYVYEKSTDHSRLNFLKKNGYLLPTLVEGDTFTGASGFDNWMNTYGVGKLSVVSLLYKVAPLAFDNLATVALNGALKYEVAKAFGVPFELMGSDFKAPETKANVAKLIPSLVSGSSYTQATAVGEVFGEQGSSVYDWSAFKTVKTDKETFYIFRFLDQVFIGKKSAVKNPYIDLVNFDYSFNKGDITPFIPVFDDNSNTVSNSQKGYNAVVLEINSIVSFVLDKIVNWDAVGGKKWVDGDNSKINDNIVNTVKALINYTTPKYPAKGQAVEYLFGNNYRTDYFNVISNAANLRDIVTGGIGIIAGRYMPNLMLPDATEMKDQSPAAFAAVVLREILTQFIPGYNYDALVYENGSDGFMEESPEHSGHFGKLLKDKSNDYWEDVCFTMGIDFGMSYLTKLLDLGQNDGGWEEDYTQTKEYNLSEFEADSSKQWKKTLDWLIDYGLGNDKEWQWSGKSLLTAYTGDINVEEDPINKIDGLLTHYFAEWKDYLSVDQFTDRPSDEPFLLKFVRGCFDAVLNVEFGKIIGQGTDYKASTYALSLNTGTEGKGLQALRDQKNIFNHFLPKGIALVNKFLSPLTSKSAFIPTGIATIDDILDDTQSKHYIDDVIVNLVESLSELIASGVLNVAGKAVNFFLGWKVLPQEFHTPTIIVKNSKSVNYVYTGEAASNTLKITNASAGMLFKHGQDGATVDNSYVLKINNIEASSGAVAFTPGTEILPFENKEFPITPGTNNSGVYYKVTYSVIGKDGQTLAENQVSYVFSYISNHTPAGVSYKEDDYATGLVNKTHLKFKYPDVNMYVKTSDSNVSVGDFIYKNLVFTDNNGQNYDYEYHLTYRTGDTKLMSNSNQVGPIYAANAATDDHPNNITLKMKMTDESKDITASGQYSLGNFDFYNLYRGKTKYNKLENINLGKLYYSNNTKVKTAFDKANEINWNGIDISAAGAAYTTFMNKMTEGAKVIYGNFADNIADFTNQDYLDNLATEIDNAYNALKGSVKVASEYTEIKTAEDEITARFDNASKSLQVTDYDKTAFFRFDELNKKAMEAYNGYIAPVHDDFYTANNANLAGKELKAKVDAESDANLKSFLTAALDHNTAGFNSATANYSKPTFTALDLKNYASLVRYYGDIMLNTAKDAPAASSLDNIKTIVSTIGEEEDTLKEKYTEASVASYMTALNKLNDGDFTRPSDEFAAKYEMQIAINGLIPKSQSMRESGNYAMLEELAKFTLQQIKDGKLTADKLKAGYDYKDTQKALITALGYEYDGKQLFKNSAWNELSVDRKTSPAMKDYVQTRYDNILNELVKFKVTVPISEFSRYQIRDINKAAQTFTSRMLVNIPNFDELYADGNWKVEITKLGFATLRRSDANNSAVETLEALKNLKTATATDVSVLKEDNTSRPDKIVISTTSTVSQNTGSLNATYGEEMSKHFYALKMNCNATEPGSIYIAPYIIYKDPITQTEKVEWMFRIVHPNFTYNKTAKPFEK